MIKVALASKTEIGDVIELFHQIDVHYFGERAAPREAMSDHVKQALFSDGCGVQVVIARDQGRPIGIATFAILYPAPELSGQLFMKDLFTTKESRGKGAGNEILRFLARHALEHGCKRFDWTAETTNPKALEFYDRLGIPRVSEKVYYRVEGAKLNELAQGDAEPSAAAAARAKEFQ